MFVSLRISIHLADSFRCHKGIGVNTQRYVHTLSVSLDTPSPRLFSSSTLSFCLGLSRCLCLASPYLHASLLLPLHVFPSPFFVSHSRFLPISLLFPLCLSICFPPPLCVSVSVSLLLPLCLSISFPPLLVSQSRSLSRRSLASRPMSISSRR